MRFDVTLVKKAEIELQDFEAESLTAAVRLVGDMIKTGEIEFDNAFDSTTVDVCVRQYEGANPFPVDEIRRTLYA